MLKLTKVSGNVLWVAPSAILTIEKIFETKGNYIVCTGSILRIRNISQEYRVKQEPQEIIDMMPSYSRVIT